MFTILKIMVVSLFYILLLFSVSPVVDHAFTPLNEEESTAQIMAEIIIQILTVTFVWYFISEYIMNKVNHRLGLKDNPIMDRSRNVITAVIMVGLQTHLVSKLEYITHKHPFRFLNLYGD